MSAAVEAAREYLRLGWCVIPVPKGEKSPNRNGWQWLKLGAEDLAREFRRAGNVGIHVGEASGGLADVDLDSGEAVELAEKFLPATWTFGRASKPRSHWLYTSPGAGMTRFVYQGETLLELRARRGLQTIVPPSIHPSGEAVAWTDDADATEAPLTVEAAQLRTKVAALAAACLVLRHAGRDATMAWLAGGKCPSLPSPVAERVREWLGLPKAQQPKRTKRAITSASTLDDAALAYNRDHARELPRPGRGDCPLCGHRDCFGELPGHSGRWACFSASHESGGVRGEACFTGDVLDLDAHAEGVARVELLRRLRYLPEVRHG